MSTDEKVNILLVDDQPAKLLSYEAILGDLGENLIKASSGREALERLLKTNIAVVLVDVCMPELDGFELASLIRQHPRCQKTAIIFVSGVHLTDLDRLKGYELGAVDYIPVPVVPDLLRAKVSVFADLYRKTQQLEGLNRELEARVAERTAELEASTARLRESEERLKLAVEGAGMGTWDVDLRTGKAYWSETAFKMLGHKPVPGGEVPVEMWDAHLHPEDREGVMAAKQRARLERSLFSPEHRIIRANNGEVAWLSASGRFLYDKTGEAVRFVGVFFDVTVRKRAEEELKRFTEKLEQRVVERTAALLTANAELERQIGERKRLEHQLLETSEREQRRIGQDLHDGLGQQLTGMVFLNNVLQEKLSQKSLREAADAKRLAQLLDQAKSHIRQLARGLHPVAPEANGLMTALEQLAESVTQLHGNSCRFDCPKPVLVPDNVVATHLFRITQEAVNNAIQHGRARQISLGLTANNGSLLLEIRDDGRGLPARRSKKKKEGLGLRIMKYRSEAIGGTLEIDTAGRSGTLVRCSVPVAKTSPSA